MNTISKVIAARDRSLLVVSCPTPTHLQLQSLLDQLNVRYNDLSVVTRVTLYRDQALVTRVLSVPPSAEVQEIRIGRLPEHVVIDSVYSQGGTSIEVRSVRVTPQAASGSNHVEIVYRAQLERDRVLGKLDFSWTGPMWIIERQVMD